MYAEEGSRFSSSFISDRFLQLSERTVEEVKLFLGGGRIYGKINFSL